MTTNSDWAMFRKLLQLVRERRADLVETKIGNCRVKIHWLGTTVRIDLQEIQ